MYVCLYMYGNFEEKKEEDAKNFQQQKDHLLCFSISKCHAVLSLVLKSLFLYFVLDLMFSFFFVNLNVIRSCWYINTRKIKTKRVNWNTEKSQLCLSRFLFRWVMKVKSTRTIVHGRWVKSNQTCFTWNKSEKRKENVFNIEINLFYLSVVQSKFTIRRTNSTTNRSFKCHIDGHVYISFFFSPSSLYDSLINAPNCTYHEWQRKNET